MCEFCGTDEERKAARVAAQSQAERLHALARHYERLASGHTKPHSDDMKRIEPSARNLIRVLVEDWV